MSTSSLDTAFCAMHTFDLGSVALTPEAIASCCLFVPLALTCVRTCAKEQRYSPRAKSPLIYVLVCIVLEYSGIRVREGNCDDLNTRRRRLARSGAIVSESTVGRYGVFAENGIVRGFQGISMVIIFSATVSGSRRYFSRLPMFLPFPHTYTNGLPTLTITQY